MKSTYCHHLQIYLNSQDIVSSYVNIEGHIQMGILST
jgi:hypothetical protein